MSDYVKELQAWIIQRQPKTRPPTKQEVLATFLGVQPFVEESIEAGYNLKTIWEYLTEQKHISFRYETFLRYVKQYITTAPKPCTTNKPAKEKQNVSRKISGFSFDAKPNTQDLI
ncbi:TraK family protein [Vibrio alginolyticus]|uniref:TraK family protein n=1 Tax=Vibrio alginolyticus TaxID=663 RepID=UPI001C9C6969|nr:TraK family protein [Vibrio fluvialis]